MNILITGITGFLGSSLARRALQNGYNVIGIKRISSKLDKISDLIAMYASNSIYVSNFSLIDAQDDFVANLSKYSIDLVIHTATNYGSANGVIDDIIKANELFPLKILDYACSHDIPFINTHSSLPNFTNQYIVSKNNFLNWGIYHNLNNAKFKFINLEVEHFYGYKDNRFVEYLIKSLINQEPSIKLTLGEQLRDFIYIDDLVDVYMLIIANLHLVTKENYKIPVGSGEVISIKELAFLIKKITLNTRSDLQFGAIPYRKNEPMILKADIAFLKSLGSAPRFSLEDGVKACIAAYKIDKTL